MCPSITENIVDADDGQETNNASWSSGTVVHAAGRDASSTFNSGYRFQTINIPQGSTINSATLRINVPSVLVGGGAPQLTVYGDFQDDAPGWSGTSRPSQMVKTTASTPYTDSTTGLKNVDVTAIVQEIISRAGWVANNDMRIAIFHTGAGTGYRKINVHDASTYGSPVPAQLLIDYTVGGGGGGTIVRQMMAHHGG